MIFQDIADKRPDLVDFFPPPSAKQITQFEDAVGFQLPASLRAIWIEWGTGYLFETEEFLSPAEDEDTGESAFSVTQDCREAGLANDLVVFHRGVGGLTCMRESGEVIQVDDSDFSKVQGFSSLDDWFNSCLMNEYGVRYGLTV